jgi:periplasmic protein TonB
MKRIFFLIVLALDFISVKAQSDSSRYIRIYHDSDNVNTFVKAERDAYFPGGKTAWINFLVANLNNDVAKKAAKRSKHFEQRVVVSFLIEKDGTLSNIKVINEVHPAIRDEAIRVISLSPAWVPAEQNGRKVKAYRQQPLTFIVN